MSHIKDAMDEYLIVLESFKSDCCEEIEDLAKELVTLFSRGNKLLICGNGGSAADSQHLAAEFVSSFSKGLKRRSLPAIALTVDTSIITAIANDFSFELVFQRQVEGLGHPGDALLAISTSGKSSNCLRAFEAARKRGMKCYALTRKDSTLYKIADYAIGVPSENTQHIQECHVIAYHLLASEVDEHFADIYD